MNSLIPLVWLEKKQAVEVIDQRILPQKYKTIVISDYETMAKAITDMIVRGAPLIGIAAAYGMALAAKKKRDLKKADQLLRSTRPTAVNLMWALDEIQKTITENHKPEKLYQEILDKARWIQEDDLKRCHAIAACGVDYIKAHLPKRKLRIMTHCNAGALATGGYGTALGVIRKLYEQDLVEMVYATETRPRQQGARLTAWELAQENIPVTLVSDTMPAHIMQKALVDLIVVGADRITAKGDAANKIGTYQLAISASYHNIPFFVAAPYSTIDMTLQDGGQIPIEERHADEIAIINGKVCTPKNIEFYNPAFDVTPKKLITALFTERGLFVESAKI